MKSFVKKRKDGGFTLAETLVALLILLMVTSIVAVGIPVAANAYTKVVDAANAQVLLSTSINALRNQLQFAKDISIKYHDPEHPDADPDLKSVSYVSSINNYSSSLKNSDDGIFLEEFKNTDAPKSRLLVSGKAATKNLYFKYDDVSYDKVNGLITFSNVGVYHRSHSGEPMVSVTTVVIKVLVP